MSVHWVKLAVNMFDDEKIKLIESMPEGDAIIVIWSKLICLAGKVNCNGYIFISENIPYSDEMLSISFNKSLPIIRLALKTFSEFGMIEIDGNNNIYLPNFEKYQNIKGLEKIREQTKLRVAKHRMETKLLLNQGKKGNVTKKVMQSNATDVDVDVDKEKKEIKEIGRIIPPSIENVKNYFSEKGIHSNEYETFYFHYESNGWIVGKTKMKNWKAAISKWISRDFKNLNNKNNGKSKSADRNTEYEQYEQSVINGTGTKNAEDSFPWAN